MKGGTKQLGVWFPGSRWNTNDGYEVLLMPQNLPYVQELGKNEWSKIKVERKPDIGDYITFHQKVHHTEEIKGEFVVDKDLEVIRIVSPFGPGWIELYNSIVWNDGDTWTLDGLSVLDILDTMGSELYGEDLDKELEELGELGGVKRKRRRKKRTRRRKKTRKKKKNK
jgi:hypothetical protein